MEKDNRIIAETPRLWLREITTADARSAYELNLDPDVIRYTGDEAFGSVEEAFNFLQQYDHYVKYGFGRWAVIHKTSGEFMGWCGLKYSPELDEHDIGFRFFKIHWNKGYATEAALACLALGFTKFGMQTIVGRVMPENKASQQVLSKIGLSYWKERISDDTTELIYRKDNDQKKLKTETDQL